MLNASNLVTSVVGSSLSVSCKSKIKQGGGLPGFGPQAIMYEGPCYGELKGGTLTLAECGLARANGMFIRNEDDKVTMGLSMRGQFLVSDQFGGCDLTILRNSAKHIFGAHVYSSDDCRSCVASPPSGWDVIGTWKSAGYLAKWPGNGGLFAFAFVEGTKVKIVAMGVKGYPPKVNNVELAATFDI